MSTPHYDTDIKLEYGVPQVFCPKFLEGKTVPSKFDPTVGRAMFTAVDGRKLFVDGESGNDIERTMRQLGIRPGEDFVRLTKIRHARGGGSSIQVELVVEQADQRGTLSVPRLSPRGPQPIPTAATPTALEAQLEKSIEIARVHGPQAFVTKPAVPARPTITDRARRFAECLADALQAYSTVDAQFATPENIRTTAITFFIQDAQDSRFVGGQR